MICTFCGKERDLHKVPSLNSNVAACGDCIKRFGYEELGLEADRILAGIHNSAAPKCSVCGAPTVYTCSGNAPVLCRACKYDMFGWA